MVVDHWLGSIEKIGGLLMSVNVLYKNRGSLISYSFEYVIITNQKYKIIKVYKIVLCRK